MLPKCCAFPWWKTRFPPGCKMSSGSSFTWLKITANKIFAGSLSQLSRFPFFPHLLAWINFVCMSFTFVLLRSAPLPSFSFHHFQFFLLYTLCLVKFISLFIHTWLDNATEHERRQENRAQVLYYTESESFPVGCCQGWGKRKWEMGKSLSRGKSLNPTSQTGVALANGN